MPCEARPVSQDDRDQVVEPFIAAACLALREFAGTEAVVRAVYRQALPPTGDDLTAVIRLTCATAGALALSCARPTAAALAGRTKALLAGMPYHFTYSPPSVVSGAEPGIRPGPESDCLVIAFGSDVGDLVLRLYLTL
jgi:CheY-specific phosphatase CheX